MKSAVMRSTLLAGLVLVSARVATATPQAHERHAPAPPPASAPAPAAAPRRDPPPSPPPAPAPRPEVRSAPPAERARAVPRAATAPERPASATGSATALADDQGRHRGGSQQAGGDRSGARAVPRADRPRGDRTPVGEARPRTSPPYTGGPHRGHGGHGGFYGPGYYWYGRPAYWYGYGLGLGYFYYDPFWWGGYSPYGYGYGPVYGGSYGYGGNYGGGGYVGSGVGQLRLKVKPRDAQVYVDGYFVGVVDDYDGTFQRLDLDAGPHKVEIRKEGLPPLKFDVQIVPDNTITYKGRLGE